MLKEEITQYQEFKEYFKMYLEATKEQLNKAKEEGRLSITF